MKRKSILIYGLAKSGISSFKLIYNKKDKFFLFDDLPSRQNQIFEETSNLSNVFVLKSLEKSIIKFMDLIVISPAISIYNPHIVFAKKQKILVVSELELGFWHTKNKILAITGTNGKTTTTSLVYEIFKTAGLSVEKVGNIGCPLCERVKKVKRKTIFVCEVSSFQLEAIKKFRPCCATILNITPDHIDRHKTYSNYKRTKFKIFENFSRKNKLILNENLKITDKKPDIYTFGFRKQKKGCYILEDKIFFANKKKETFVCSTKQIKIIGKHNLENIMAAICFAKIFKIKNESISKALKTFVPFPHRIEKVYETLGISFYDDSKATNTDAAIRAVQSFEKEIFLILGGSDKGYEYFDIFKKLPKNVVKIIACGQVREKIKNAANQLGFKDIKSFETLKESVIFCCENLKSGQVLLLSPASASFDEFKNYKDRGKKFLKYIKDFYEGS